MMKINKENILKLIREGKRLDNRNLEEFRPIEIFPNYIKKNPEGSALVKIGNTQVLVGVKMGIGEPYPDSPDEGVLMTGAELVPLASPDYESGPPREDAIELARVVDRGIRESGMIDMKSLCIKKKEKVWMVFLDIHVLDYDGNLIDASALGAVTALSFARVPKYDEKEDKIDYENYSGKLKLNDLPVTVTARKINGKIIFDTTADEEEVAEARLTFEFKENGNICAMQKGGTESLTNDEIIEMMKKSFEISKEIRKKIKSLKLDK